MDFLDAESTKYPAQAAAYQKLADLYQGKLWHQLTEELAALVVTPGFATGRNLIDLYDSFLSTFESKLNQLKFVQIVSVIAQQYMPARPVVADEVNEAIAFMESISEKKARLGEEAYLVSQMAIAEFLVQLGTPETLKRARGMLDEAQPVLISLEGSGAETFVNSSFYRVSCEYYKAAGPADEFYRSCIQFLAFTPVDTLDKTVQRQLAVDMSLAALVGESLFNYGEVVAQPVLAVLEGTEDAWLGEMLNIFSAGNIDAFSAVCANQSAAINAQPVLVQNFELLKQKIALLCLMQVIFDRPPEDRTLHLSEVAKVTKLEINQAEWLLMKAMSKGLVKGKIDQVEQVVNISWLKPRVLDKAQQSTLKDKLGLWKEHVGKTLLFVEEESPELFHQHN